MVEGKSSYEYELLFKIVLVGDASVGKTNILSRFTSNTFNIESKPTIGVEFATKSLMIKDKNVKAQIWDTAGQERYRAITGSYYKGATGAMIIYDITKLISFQNVDKWLKELQDHCENKVFVMLVGNKSDLKHLRVVKQEEGASYAQKHGLAFIETSALESYNIDQAFEIVLSNICESQSQIPKMIKAQGAEKLKEGTTFDKKDSKGCCSS